MVASADEFADVCSVTPAPEGVMIHVGRRIPSQVASDAVGVALTHRIELGEAGAARLQDMMTELLQSVR